MIPAGLRFGIGIGLFACAAAGASAQEAPAGVHGRLRLRIECVACHTPAGWRPLRADLQFDHARDTGFPLEGKHAAAACVSCHQGLRFDQPRATATECVSCHQDVHQGRLSDQCASCHNTRSFSEAARREFHDRTSFPLTGPHAAVPCDGCHRSDRGGAFTALATECVACHRADYQAAHGAQGFPEDCLSCHQPDHWSGARFDHPALANGFALVGAHAAQPCSSCHVAPDNHVRWTPANQNDCIACHQADYTREHAGSAFPTTCLSCHTVNQWQGATFDHATVSGGFALVGAHAQQPCSGCHVAPDNHVRWTPANQNDCVACHRSDYDREHAGSGFPTTCSTCHNVNRWEGATFNHATVARGFALVGAHAAEPCSSCHVAPDNHLRWTPAGQNDCVACHRSDYDAHHAGSGYPTTCTSCHTVSSWSGVNIDHAALSGGFALVGAHAAEPCASCHVAPDNHVPWTPTSQNDCVACHRSDYDAHHAGSGFPTTCTSCHTVNQWQGATFNHSTVSGGFALVGAHAAEPCTSCHVAPDNHVPWTPTSQNDCVACHRSDYDAHHAGSGFPTTCTSCHTVNQWQGATFNHSTVSGGFALVGAHAAEPCSSCHVAPDNHVPWTPTSQNDCVACHRSDYDAHHAGSGYPTTCTSCHTVNQWQGATFNHSTVSGGFALVGAHAAEPCTSCHVAPDNHVPWTPTSQNDCVACHRSDYDAHHAGTGYPTTCTTCHTVNTWTGATFNHDAAFFPIYSGKHQGKWSTCQQCHPSSADFGVFTCLTCHLKAKTDTDHSQVAGYSYDSLRCLSCHPKGD